MISEELPTAESGYRYSNSDPVTGQAAWYDVRVRVYPAEANEPEQTWPQFEPQPAVPGMTPRRSKWQSFVRGLKS